MPRINPSDPDTYRGRTVDEVKDALNNDPNWTGPTPSKDGNGDRWVRDGSKGADQVIVNKGYPRGLEGGGGDSVHSGPYARISIGGKIIRIPLQ